MSDTPLGRLLLAIEPDAAGLEAKLGATLGGSRIAGIFGKAGAGAALGFGAAFAGGLAIAGTLEHIGSKFHTAFATIRVETGATGHVLDGLEGSFKNVLSKTPAGFGDVASAIATVNQKLGLTGQPLESVALSVIRLSRITKTDLQGNLSSVTSLFNNWNVSSRDQVGTLDQLFRASQKSGVGVGELAAEATQGGIQLRNVGFTLKDSVSLLALLGKQGLGVSTIIPGIAKAMALAAKEGKPAAQVFRDTFTAIKNAPNDTKAAGIALDVFGARAGPKLGALIRSGKLSWEDFSKSIAKGDTIKKAAADVGTWQGKLAIFRNEIEVKLQPIATKVFDGMGKAVVWVGTQVGIAFGPSGVGTRAIAWFRGVIGDLSAWWDAHSVQIIATAYKLAAGVGTGINGIRTAISGIVSFFQDNESKFSALGANIVSVWHQVAPTVTAAFDLVRAIISKDVLFITTVWDKFGARITSSVFAVFNGIVTEVKGALQVLRGIIEIATGILTLHWSKVWQGIRDVVSGVWNVIKGQVYIGLAEIGLVISLGLGAIQAVWSRIWGGFTTGIDAIFGVIERAAATGINKLIDIINGLIRAYNKLPFVPNIGTIGHVSWGVGYQAPKTAKPGDPGFIGPLLPGEGAHGGTGGTQDKHASGGVAAANRWSLFGEKGVELARPTTAMRIYPADVSRDILLGANARGGYVDARTVVEGHVYGDAHLQRIFDEHDRKVAATLKAGQHP